MSYEFIAAKDLPTTEAEEVDVLCIENGELKLKEGASLGGGGSSSGSEWDAVIEIVGNADNVEEGEGIDGNFLTVGSFDAIKAKIDSGEMPNILILWTLGNEYVSYTNRAKAITVAFDGGVHGGNTIYVYFCSFEGNFNMRYAIIDQVEHVSIF